MLSTGPILAAAPRAPSFVLVALGLPKMVLMVQEVTLAQTTFWMTLLPASAMYRSPLARFTASPWGPFRVAASRVAGLGL